MANTADKVDVSLIGLQVNWRDQSCIFVLVCTMSLEDGIASTADWRATSGSDVARGYFGRPVEREDNPVVPRRRLRPTWRLDIPEEETPEKAYRIFDAPNASWKEQPQWVMPDVVKFVLAGSPTAQAVDSGPGSFGPRHVPTQEASEKEQGNPVMKAAQEARKAAAEQCRKVGTPHAPGDLAFQRRYAAMPMPQNITKAQEEARLGIFRWGWTAQSGQGTASQNPPDPVKSETVALNAREPENESKKRESGWDRKHTVLFSRDNDRLQVNMRSYFDRWKDVDDGTHEKEPTWRLRVERRPLIAKSASKPFMPKFQPQGGRYGPWNPVF
eukprot:s385_g7.t2